MTKLATIINERKKPVEIPNKGFYRPVFEGTVSYSTDGGEVRLTPLDTTRLAAQKFTFSVGRNRGRVYVNGYSGRAKVEFTRTESCGSVAELKLKMADVKKSVYEAVALMGDACFDGFDSEPKKSGGNAVAGPHPRKIRVASRPATAPTLVLVDKKDRKAAAAKTRRRTVPEVITYSLDHWDRRAHWVTAREGVNYTVPLVTFNGVTKFLRKGGKCYRHL